MIILLLLLSILGYVAVTLGTGALSKKLFKNNADQLYFQLIRNAVSLILIVAVYRAVFPSAFTVLMAAAMGLALMLSSVFSMVAFKYGPVSISVLIISSLAMVFSALCGPLFWREPISIWQIMGIILSVASMALLTEKALIQKTSAVWIIALFLSGLGGGLQGVIQKVLAMSEYSGENMEFVTYSILFSVIVSLVLLIFVRKKNNEQISYKMDRKVFGIFVLQAGLFVFLNVNNLKLVSELPTVVFFPAYSIGGLLLATVLSIIIFKEKMTKRQIAGFIAGMVALLLISGTLESIG